MLYILNQTFGFFIEFKIDVVYFKSNFLDCLFIEFKIDAVYFKSNVFTNEHIQFMRQVKRTKKYDGTLIFILVVLRRKIKCCYQV